MLNRILWTALDRIVLYYSVLYYGVSNVNPHFSQPGLGVFCTFTRCLNSWGFLPELIVSLLLHFTPSVHLRHLFYSYKFQGRSCTCVIRQNMITSTRYMLAFFYVFNHSVLLVGTRWAYGAGWRTVYDTENATTRTAPAWTVSG